MKKTVFYKDYKNYYNSFMMGNYNDLANATKLVSKLCLSYIHKNIDGNSKFMESYMDDKIKKYMNVEIQLKDITKYKLGKFCKNIQKPYLPLLLYPKLQSGSCHDISILRTILHLKNNKNVCIKIYDGYNKKMSHINTMSCSSIKKTSHDMLFILLSLFHVYRTYSVLESKDKENFKNTISRVVKSILKNEEKSINTTNFLFSRTYDRLMKVNY